VDTSTYVITSKELQVSKTHFTYASDPQQKLCSVAQQKLGLK